jgi:hypothetical protein
MGIAMAKSFDIRFRIRWLVYTYKLILQVSLQFLKKVGDYVLNMNKPKRSVWKRGHLKKRSPKRGLKKAFPKGNWRLKNALKFEP